MGVGKVPEEAEGGFKRSYPKSGTHQAPSHWEPQWKEAQKNSKNKNSIQRGGKVKGKKQP